jgi:hypothetical protein
LDARTRTPIVLEAIELELEPRWALESQVESARRLDADGQRLAPPFSEALGDAVELSLEGGAVSRAVDSEDPWASTTSAWRSEFLRPPDPAHYVASSIDTLSHRSPRCSG